MEIEGILGSAFCQATAALVELLSEAELETGSGAVSTTVRSSSQYALHFLVTKDLEPSFQGGCAVGYAIVVTRLVTKYWKMRGWRFSSKSGLPNQHRDGSVRETSSPISC